MMWHLGVWSWKVAALAQLCHASRTVSTTYCNILQGRKGWVSWDSCCVSVLHCVCEWVVYKSCGSCTPWQRWLKPMTQWPNDPDFLNHWGSGSRTTVSRSDRTQDTTLGDSRSIFTWDYWWKRHFPTTTWSVNAIKQNHILMKYDEIWWNTTNSHEVRNDAKRVTATEFFGALPLHLDQASSSIGRVPLHLPKGQQNLLQGGGLNKDIPNLWDQASRILHGPAILVKFQLSPPSQISLKESLFNKLWQAFSLWDLRI